MLVAAFLVAFGHMYVFARVGVIFQIVHGGGVGHRGRREGLHLIGHQMVFAGNLAQLRHLDQGASGMCRDKVGDELLVLAAALVFFLEECHEVQELAEFWFAHQAYHLRVGVLWRHLESPRDVLVHQLVQISFRPTVFLIQQQLVAYAAADGDVLDSLQLGDFLVQLDHGLMVAAQVGANLGMQTGGTGAGAA